MKSPGPGQEMLQSPGLPCWGQGMADTDGTTSELQKEAGEAEQDKQKQEVVFGTAVFLSRHAVPLRWRA